MPRRILIGGMQLQPENDCVGKLFSFTITKPGVRDSYLGSFLRSDDDTEWTYHENDEEMTVAKLEQVVAILKKLNTKYPSKPKTHDKNR